MATAPKTQDVYLLPLADDGAPKVEGQYILLPPPNKESPYRVCFEIQGTSSICRQGSLWVNIPAKGEQFKRDRYREYKLDPDFNGTIKHEIPIYEANAYSFYTTYTPLPQWSFTDVTPTKPTRTPTYYIDVSPRLTLHGEQLPIESISLFTCLSKFMGTYPADWNKHLKGISERGYNMVHFTPLNIRGESNSPYSIYDQHRFDTAIFPEGEEDVAHLVEKMQKDYNLLAMTDVVWNHTAHNSKWLEEHPEAGYNVDTAPWLRPALVLDTELLQYSRDLSSLGLPTKINSQDDLIKIMEGVKTRVLAKANLWQFYVVDKKKATAAVVQSWTAGHVNFPDDSFREAGLRGLDAVKKWPLKQKADWIVDHAFEGGDRFGERYRRSVVPDTGAALLNALFGRYDTRTSDTPDQSKAIEAMNEIVDEINLQFYREYDTDVAEIMEQLFNRIKYCRLDDHGPKMGEITDSSPLIEPYFTRLPLNETTKKHNPEALALVNNGWVWAADAMRDNAGPKSRAYLRREVIVWGDCVKLRYGNGPEDNPYLWEHMAKYTRLMAKYFQGFRIDNCHSTPIHLASYMLDQARTVNPNLFTVAELFSGSEEMDFKFVKELGIHALIRECMQAWSTQELSRLVHRHGGVPIGSFDTDEVTNAGSSATTVNQDGARRVVKKIKKSPVHALFMDCTHDNETPAQKRDARDTLSSAALVAMCSCATGSVFGFDEVYPELIELVHEKRPYKSINSSGGPIKPQAGEGGIGGIRKILNGIHVEMGKKGYDETYIHHDNEYVTVHRVNPRTRKGYFLIAHTAFPGYGNGNGGFGPTNLPGTQAKLIGAWNLEVDNSPETRKKVIGDKVLRGLPSRTKDIRGVVIEKSGDSTTIRIPENFPPGSIALFETSVPSAEHDDGLDKFITSGAREAFSKCTLTDLNHVLYRCDPEERDGSDGRDGAYNVPGHGSLVYAGLQGWWSVLRGIVEENNLGHPLCNHLREGQWALDYCVGRLNRLAKKEEYRGIAGPAKWLEERCDRIRQIPSFLLPRSFAMVIQTAYNAAVDRAVELMGENVRHGPAFLRSLSLVSVQMTGLMNSTSLWANKSVPSMAAGLPHFANDWARCWGRDICISARGLLMGTGRYDDAKEHILAFASVVKHGMIPNLLSSGKLPRYNSRDSVWWFTQNIQDYTKIVPGGRSLLQEKAPRRFLPYDDTWFPWDDKRAYSQSSTIEDVIQEILQRHATGLEFREYDAGPNIDSQMKDEGFNIKVQPDWETGMIFGGNQWNCGTWMDKMGESEKAGSKGVPGTPRDGAPVEIIGMLFSCLNWVADLHEAGHYKYEGVTLDGGKKAISFRAWADKIKANFERTFYVPRRPEEDKDYDVNPKIINRRGIYKDTYRGGKEYEDYQLRPNFSIAMTVAPQLFNPDHALYALEVADKNLLGPVGMKTLDPSDYNYRPFYINSEDSTDFHTSKGRNYHQGPEWGWPLGFHCRALLKFDLQRRKTPEERVESYQQVTRRMAGMVRQIEESPWAGLTELSQKDGAFCGDSCPTQAWSASCLIDVFQDAWDTKATLAGNKRSLHTSSQSRPPKSARTSYAHPAPTPSGSSQFDPVVIDSDDDGGNDYHDDEEDASQEVQDPSQNFGDTHLTYVKYGYWSTRITGKQYYTGTATAGEIAILRHNYHNQYDANAIQVLNVNRQQIGHVPMKTGETRKIAPYMDDGSLIVEATIPGALGRYEGPIDLHFYGPDDPEMRANLVQKMRNDRFPTTAWRTITEREKEERQREKERKKQAKQAAKAAKAALNRNSAAVGSGQGLQFDSPDSRYAAGASEVVEPGPSLEDIIEGSERFNPRNADNIVEQYGAAESDLATMPKAAQPVALSTELHDFQLQGLHWLLEKESPQLPANGTQDVVQLWQRHATTRGAFTNIATKFSEQDPVLASAGILADDMGLGKTIQTISLIMADRELGRRAPDSSDTTLILAPVSVMSNWSTQIKRHIKEEYALRVMFYHVTRKEPITPKSINNYDVIISTYESVSSEWHSKKSTELPRKSGVFSVKWRRIILDEGHAIRNPKAKKTVAVTNLMAQSRWALTGTPIINKLKDLYSLVRFLRLSGGLSTLEIFNTAIMRPVMHGHPNGNWTLQQLMGGICLRRRKDMSFIDLRLPKLTEYKYKITLLPHEKEKYDAFEAQAKGTLELYRQQAGGKGATETYRHLLEVLLRMRQLCNHWKMISPERIDSIMKQLEAQGAVDLTPANKLALQQMLQLSIDSQEDCPICLDTYKDPIISKCAHTFCTPCLERVIETQHKCPLCRSPLDSLLTTTVKPLKELPSPSPQDGNTDTETSSKVTALLSILKASSQDPSTKTIIFSQWTSFLSLLEPHLLAASLPFTRIDGSMPAPARDTALDRFDTDPECTIMLASLSVCSVGLNLVAANQVILSDSWWAPAIEDQAVDRMHRLGQRRETTVWRLVVEGSIEENVLEVQEGKRKLMGVAFREKAGKEGGRRAVGVADLERLLGAGR